MNVIGILCGTGLMLYFAKTAAQVGKKLWRPEWRYERWLQALMLVLVAGCATLLLLIGFKGPLALYDRYLLFFVPPSFVLVLVDEIHSGPITRRRWRGGYRLPSFSFTLPFRSQRHTTTWLGTEPAGSRAMHS